MNIVDVYKQFPTQDSCIEHLEKVRWHGKPACPYCKSTKVTPLKKEKRHHCNNCNTSFSITVGTIFHKTKVDFQKWFVAISLMLNAKKGISARQLSRDLSINKDTAWYMAMRIRRAMIEHGDLLEGIVEVDETYVGGKTHGKGSGYSQGNKTPVFGMAQRNGVVRAQPVKHANGKNLKPIIRRNISRDSIIMSDEFGGYKDLNKEFMDHKIVVHSRKQYVCGNAHTNSIEGFWALLKRGIYGQYHRVSKKHLAKYVNEFCYRYNNRKNELIFQQTISKALGV
jgi:transposase-like protein